MSDDIMTVDRYINLFKAFERNSEENLDLDQLYTVTFQEPGGALMVPSASGFPFLILSRANASVFEDLLPEIKRRWKEEGGTHDG